MPITTHWNCVDRRTAQQGNGTVYHFDQDSGVDVAGFRTGDKVTITTYTMGDQHIAEDISATG